MRDFVSVLGLLTTLNFIGACNLKVYLIFVDPKSKILQKSDQNEESYHSALLSWRAAKIGRSAMFG